jgi:surface protein
MAIKITSKTKHLVIKPILWGELRAIIEQELRTQGPDAYLNHIDVSLVTDMCGLFENTGYEIGNIKIDEWDVSNVKNMSHMFYDCTDLNCAGIGDWDVSNVTDMTEMFYGCKQFNCDLSSWNLSNLKYSDGMLLYAHKLEPNNRPII